VVSSSDPHGSSVILHRVPRLFILFLFLLASTDESDEDLLVCQQYRGTK